MVETLVQRHNWQFCESVKNLQSGEEIIIRHFLPNTDEKRFVEHTTITVLRNGLNIAEMIATEDGLKKLVVYPSTKVVVYTGPHRVKQIPIDNMVFEERNTSQETLGHLFRVCSDWITTMIDSGEYVEQPLRSEIVNNNHS